LFPDSQFTRRDVDLSRLSILYGQDSACPKIPVAGTVGTGLGLSTYPIKRALSMQINRSTNQQINRSTDQQINKSTDQQINKSTEQQINKSTDIQIKCHNGTWS
jgi:hypothetical protein